MKEIIYNITQQTEGRKVAITGVNEPVNKSNVLGIINKTQSKVLYTPLQYANLISSEWSSLDGGTLTLTLADNVQIIKVGDKLFVKLYLDKDIDFSALAQEDTLTQGIQAVKDAIATIPATDLTPLEQAVAETTKEATLLAKVAELKEALNTIDFTAIEQAIQGVEDVTAKEATLIQGVEDIIKAVENIDFTDLENSIAEVKNAVVNIDFSALAQEDTLKQGVNTISQKIDDIHMPELDKSDLAKEATLSSGISTLSNKIDNIDLSSVENKVDEGVETLSNKIDNIDLSSVESKVETESQTIQSAIQNIDLSSVERKVDEVKQAVENIDLSPIESKVEEGVNTLSSKIDNIDLSAVENKVQEESTAIQNKIDNIKLPEIDTSELAKQGENTEATNSKIYDAVKAIPDLSLLYAARAEKNDDGVNTYSIILPVTAKVIYDDNEVATIQL